MPNPKATHTRTDQDLCSSRSIGYSIGQIVANTTRVAYATSNLDALTKTFVLHPVAAGMTFFAFLVAAVSHRLGFIFSALVASLGASQETPRSRSFH